jgi:hypothetical protein
MIVRSGEASNVPIPTFPSTIPPDWLGRLRTAVGLAQHPVAKVVGIMLTFPGKVDDSNRDSLFGREVVV